MESIFIKWLKGKGKYFVIALIIGLVGDRTFVQNSLNELENLVKVLNKALELEKTQNNNVYQEHVDTFYLENPSRFAIIKDRE